MVCDHEWVGVGVSTVSDPPVFDYACFKCRTFRHVSDQGGRWYGKEEVRFAETWTRGPWDWEEQEAKLRARYPE